nr:MAG TPA: hypothetical protein [Caudoviricetes sp.]
MYYLPSTYPPHQMIFLLTFLQFFSLLFLLLP